MHCTVGQCQYIHTSTAYHMGIKIEMCEDNEIELLDKPNIELN